MEEWGEWFEDFISVGEMRETNESFLTLTSVCTVASMMVADEELFVVVMVMGGGRNFYPGVAPRGGERDHTVTLETLFFSCFEQ